MQEFLVVMDFADGETWKVSIPAEDPVHALSKVLRRKYWIESLLSERLVRFTVDDVWEES